VGEETSLRSIPLQLLFSPKPSSVNCLTANLASCRLAHFRCVTPNTHRALTVWSLLFTKHYFTAVFAVLQEPHYLQSSYHPQRKRRIRDSRRLFCHYTTSSMHCRKKKIIGFGSQSLQPHRELCCGRITIYSPRWSSISCRNRKGAGLTD
jgi:hypothetical protein